MANFGTERTPIYSLRAAMKGRAGGPTGVREITNVISITTQKSIGDPAGSFEITLDGSRSIDGLRPYDVLSPNDYLDIRFGVLPRYPTPVPVMRGFIDNIRIVEDPGATPSRQIIISGRDYGKIWLVVKLLNIYPPATSALATLIPRLYVQSNGDFVPTVGLSLNAFFTFLIERVVRPYLLMQQQLTGGAIDGGVMDCTELTDIDTSLLLPDITATQWNNDIYSWLKNYQNAPWIEIFSRDNASGPCFYLRWARTRTSDFRQIDPFDTPLAPLDASHTLTYKDDILADHLGRTDNDAANWFFTGNAFGNQVDANVLNANFIPGTNPYIAGASIDALALRKIAPSITFFPPPNDLSSDAIKAAVSQHAQIAAAFNLWLVKMYGFQEKIENGTVMSLGWPDFRIGDEVRIADTDMSYYLEGVGHRFSVNESYTMQLTVTRGMPYNNGRGFDLPWDVMTPYQLPKTYPNIVNIVTDPSTLLPTPTATQSSGQPF